jgi:hypothetical protein
MTRLHSINERLRQERGAVAIWFALLLPVLLGFAALAVDLARIHLVKVELQNAADAAAMGGARSLTDAGGTPFNWSAAADSARAFARRNVANGSRIQDATIETGYWNLQSRSWSGTSGTGYVPAVRATIGISEGQNSGPLNLLFAPILGIDESNVQASAIAVIAPAGGGTGLFPFAINKNMFDTYWDSTNNKPQVDSNNNPIELKYGMNSVYFDKDGNQYTSGTWTTFDTTPASANNVKKYLDGTLTSDVTSGMNINLESGVDDDAFHKTGDLYTNKDVPIVVVDQKIVPGGTLTVYAIGGFHIDGVDKIKGKSYISGHFIDPTIFGNLDPGNGTGTSYGAYTPPILVK